MGEQYYLTSAEFERWARHFDQQLTAAITVRDHVRELVAQNATRIAVLEDRALAAPSKSASGAISAVVAGVVSGLVSIFTGSGS